MDAIEQQNKGLILKWLNGATDSFFDDTIELLIKTFPNHAISQLNAVGIKLATIDSLMRTKASQKGQQIKLLAQRMVASKDLDEWIKSGDAKAVNIIAKLGNGIQNNFSLATKYCYWHNTVLHKQCKEPFIIYDNNVIQGLRALNCCEGRREFTTQDLSNKKIRNYATYKTVFKEFMKCYGLDSLQARQVELALYQLYKNHFVPLTSFRRKNTDEEKNEYKESKADDKKKQKQDQLTKYLDDLRELRPIH